MYETAVVFRKWKDISTVIALFPELPSDYQGFYCDSYERLGGHGGTDYYGIIAASVPARPDEYSGLQRELERIGYRLRIVQRASSEMHARCREEARRCREVTVV